MTTPPILALAVFAFFSWSDIAQAAGAAAVPVSPALQWLKRPWEIRYVLFVDSVRGMNSSVKLTGAANAAPDKPGRKTLYLDAEEMFELTATFNVPGEDPVATVVISFDAAGRVTGPNKRLSQFVAKRSLIDSLVLVRDGAPHERPYYFADWSQGIPGDVSVSPAVCDVTDTHRYEDDWNSDGYTGNFGCREWTAQLYQTDQPYINVTSYTGHGNFIGEFVGWSRLTDPAKPIIGQHGKTWLCLHECPAEEKAGIIPDISAWTAKHRYPMPARPSKQPLYPNRDYDFND